MSWQPITRRILVGTIFLLSAYDIAAYLYGGPGSTISEVILDAARQHPALPFAAGFLCGHLFWPQ